MKIMKLNEIKKRPHHKVDVDAKAYIVFDENDKEVDRFPFPAVWDSSPALKKAQAKVSELIKLQVQQDANDRENQALNKYEQEYSDLHKQFTQHLAHAKSLDAARKEEYLLSKKDELDKIQHRLTALADMKSFIRTSVLIGEK